MVLTGENNNLNYKSNSKLKISLRQNIEFQKFGGYNE